MLAGSIHDVEENNWQEEQQPAGQAACRARAQAIGAAAQSRGPLPTWNATNWR